MICSLTLSLATRFCTQFSSLVRIAHSVERRSVEPKRHFIPDTIRWGQVAGPAVWATARLYRRVASTKPLPRRDRLDESLYNRPPPPFGFILQLPAIILYQP
jgi:hypothetical protein